MTTTAVPDPRRWWILGVLSLSLLIIGLDNTILNVALPTIERDLSADPGQLQWIVDSYLLVFAGLLLTMGSLGDRFGRGKALAAGLVVFGTGSLLSAFAPSAEALIASRGLMGVGGALVMPATLSILTNVFPPGERAKAIGIWAAVSGLGVAIGPTAGGLLLEHFAWGAVFLINIPVVVVALVAGAKLIPDSHDPETPPVDLRGAALSIAGLTALVYGLIDAPEAGWTAGSTLAIFGVAAALLATFVWWELRAPHPMLDVRLFHNRRFTAASGALTLAFFSLFGSIFFLTQHMQGVLGFDPLEAGVRLLPVAGGLMLAAPLSALLTKRFGAKLTVSGGMTLVGLGLAAMLLADGSAGYGPVALSMAILSFGLGTVMAPATDSVMGALPPAKAGVGSAVNDTARMVGGALGVAVLGSVLAGGYRGGMDDAAVAGLPRAAADAAQESHGAALAVAEKIGERGDALAAAATDAFVAGMHSAALIAAAVAIAGAVLAALWLPAREAEPEPRGGALGAAVPA